MMHMCVRDIKMFYALFQSANWWACSKTSHWSPARKQFGYGTLICIGLHLVIYSSDGRTVEMHESLLYCLGLERRNPFTRCMHMLQPLSRISLSILIHHHKTFWSSKLKPIQTPCACSVYELHKEVNHWLIFQWPFKWSSHPSHNNKLSWYQGWQH